MTDVDDMSSTAPVVSEEKIQQQKEALGQMKISKKPVLNEDSKENLLPASELENIELTTVKKLKNDENTSDSLKSLDGVYSFEGSAIDNEESDKNPIGKQQEELPIKDAIDNHSGDTTDEITSPDNIDATQINNDVDETQINNDQSTDAISTSDIIADMSSTSETINPVDQTVPSSPTEEITDEQKILQAQANYGLTTSNYKKEETAEAQDSDSDAELFSKENCKCENIRQDVRTKTKVCKIL